MYAFLIAQQQQSPQVYVSQSAAAQIPAFYMDTSHLFNTQHARLAPPSLAQQQGFQPGLSQPTSVQQIPIPIYAPLQGQHQAQLSLGAGPAVSQAQELFSSSLQPYRSQPAFMQSNLSQPSVVLSGTAIHNFPAGKLWMAVPESTTDGWDRLLCMKAGWDLYG